MKASSPESIASVLFDAEARAVEESPLRRPASTYRLQLHREFRLEDVERILPYLHALGISDAYLSPHLDARPGSTHGYDVFDHGRLNDEIGTDAQYDRLRDQMESLGMGRVLDIVPNHMGIGGFNRFWIDVLETGPQAPAERFFDIDWNPVKDELEGRVLLPILEDQYGVVLERGLLKLEREGGAFFIRYYDNRLPVSPRSYALILAQRKEVLNERFDHNDERVMEFRSIRDSARNLPPRTETDAELVEPKLREKEVIKTAHRPPLFRKPRAVPVPRREHRPVPRHPRRPLQLRPPARAAGGPGLPPGVLAGRGRRNQLPKIL